jgi:small conductance mechanosensitive channel
MNVDVLLPFIQSFGKAILIAFVGYLVAFVVNQVLQKALEKPLGKTWSRFIGRLVALGIVIYALKLILDQTGAAGLVVILATAVTGALAIGSEGLASDLVAALIIFFTKPFEINHYVMIGDHEGTVVNITMTATSLDSYDGSRIVLRNRSVLDSTIVNYSANPALRIEVNVPVPLSEDLEKAVQVLFKSIDTFEPQVKSADLPPHVILASTSFGYAEFQIRVFIPSTEYFGVQRMRVFMHAVNALKAAGISTKA